jgi:hypothetical protein
MLRLNSVGVRMDHWSYNSDWENRITRRNTSYIATVSTKNPTWKATINDE